MNRVSTGNRFRNNVCFSTIFLSIDNVLEYGNVPVHRRLQSSRGLGVNPVRLKL